ncbi:MAG: fumarylacetoacetate hydrolase family protein [Bacillota bacterium]|nr:fumarylacetoacetate hydrolase family protein [Bacillota bacterium]
MSRARFIAEGRLLEGEWRHGEGVLLTAEGRRFLEEEVTFLPPVNPRTVVGLALNFADHAGELSLEVPKEPILFIKPVSSLIGHGAPVRYPKGVQYMHYEGELAVVVGRESRRLRAGEALEAVAGFTLANDVTVRDFVGNFYRPPVRAKGFDTFGPLGPALYSLEELGDPGKVQLEVRVNGEVRQAGNTSHWIFDIGEVLEFITAFMTLYPGDVVLMGTPPGISPVKPGDVMEVAIPGLATLRNLVVAEGGMEDA